MDGLSLMDQLDLLRQDVNDIHGQVKRDKIDKEEMWLMIRATTLDDWGKYQLRTSRDIRNTVVHGGSILTDIQVTKSFDTVESCERVTVWKNAFQRSVWNTLWRSGEVEIPEKMLHVLNKRASAFHLISWKNDEKRCRDIILFADLIILDWRNGASLFEDKSITLLRFNAIERLAGSLATWLGRSQSSCWRWGDQLYVFTLSLFIFFWV